MCCTIFATSYLHTKLFTQNPSVYIHAQTHTDTQKSIKTKRQPHITAVIKNLGEKKVVKRGFSPVEFDRPRLRCEESAKVIFGTAAGKRET